MISLRYFISASRYLIILISLLVVSLRLRFLDFPAFLNLAFMDKKDRKKRRFTHSQTKKAINSLSKILPFQTCLIKSVVYLQRSELAHNAELVIGVRNSTGQFKSHSWIRDEERVLYGETDELSEYKSIHKI